jgi:hypothetical protein
MSRHQLLEGFRSLVPGIVELDVTMQKDQGKPDENRGFCFIEMYNQTAAEQAIAKLTAPDLELAGECVPIMFPSQLILRELCAVNRTRDPLLSSIDWGLYFNWCRQFILIGARWDLVPCSKGC